MKDEGGCMLNPVDGNVNKFGYGHYAGRRTLHAGADAHSTN